MHLALACLFLWTGSALLYLATRPLQATSPWEAYQTLLSRLRGE